MFVRLFVCLFISTINGISAIVYRCYMNSNTTEYIHTTYWDRLICGIEITRISTPAQLQGSLDLSHELRSSLDNLVNCTSDIRLWTVKKNPGYCLFGFVNFCEILKTLAPHIDHEVLGTVDYTFGPPRSDTLTAMLYDISNEYTNRL